ncbi:MAG: SDR family NAD(P)-dependent oxidoreductase [Marmoricola sp.]
MDDERLRVLVTGGTSGLGAALAAAYADRGARVLVGAKGPDSVHGLVPNDVPQGRDAAVWDQTAGISVRQLDVRSDDDWAAAVGWVEQQWGGLDVLVNNAGVAGGGRVDVTGLDEWQWITETNLFGVVRGTRAFVPMMKRQGSGRIVNVASVAGLVHPAGMGSYNAVKAAVVAFTETIGHELAGHGIHASVVCPSYFRTRLMDSSWSRDEAVGRVLGHLVETSPLGPDDIAAAVLEGLDRGEELILPDPAAEAAYRLKREDRAEYDRVMRAQAAKLEEAT